MLVAFICQFATVLYSAVGSFERPARWHTASIWRSQRSSKARTSPWMTSTLSRRAAQRPEETDEHYGNVTRREELPAEHDADVTGTAGDENAHRLAVTQASLRFRQEAPKRSR